MEKPNETEEERAEAQKFYNYAQIFLIKYMLHKGIVASAEEYADKFAEIFDMLASGALQTRRKVDWNGVRKKMDAIRSGTADKIKSFKIFDDEEDGGEGSPS